MRRNYPRDPYWLSARFDSTCSHCHRKIKTGALAFYFPNDKSIFCDAEECGQRESRGFEAIKFDEAQYNASY